MLTNEIGLCAVQLYLFPISYFSPVRLWDDGLLKKFHHVEAQLLALAQFVLPEKERMAALKTFGSQKPEKLHDLLPHLVKLVLDVFRKLSAKTLHPGEVFLASVAPAAELEALVQLLLPLLQGVAEVVDPVVVRHLLAGLDRPLRHEEHLVAVDVQPQGVRLTAVVEQQKSWEYGSSNLPEDWTCSSFNKN